MAQFAVVLLPCSTCFPAFSATVAPQHKADRFEFLTRISAHAADFESMAFSVLDNNSRFEKSLGLLTTRFVTLLQEAEGGILDLKVVSDAQIGILDLKVASDAQTGILDQKVVCDTQAGGRHRYFWSSGMA